MSFTTIFKAADIVVYAYDLLCLPSVSLHFIVIPDNPLWVVFQQDRILHMPGIAFSEQHFSLPQGRGRCNCAHNMLHPQWI